MTRFVKLLALLICVVGVPVSSRADSKSRQNDLATRELQNFLYDDGSRLVSPGQWFPDLMDCEGALRGELEVNSDAENWVHPDFQEPLWF